MKTSYYSCDWSNDLARVIIGSLAVLLSLTTGEWTDCPNHDLPAPILKPWRMTGCHSTYWEIERHITLKLQVFLSAICWEMKRSSKYIFQNIVTHLKLSVTYIWCSGWNCFFHMHIELLQHQLMQKLFFPWGVAFLKPLSMINDCTCGFISRLFSFSFFLPMLCHYHSLNRY